MRGLFLVAPTLLPCVALVCAGCGGSIRFVAHRDEGERPRVRVEARLRSEDGSIRERVRIDGHEGAIELYLAPALAVRCAGEDAPPARCEVTRPFDGWRLEVRGDEVELIVEGRLDDESREHPYVGEDRVELRSSDFWYPTPRSEDVELELDVSLEGDLELVGMPPLAGRTFAARDVWSVLAMRDMVTERRDCGEHGIELSYDDAFPGPAVSRRIAGWACSAIERISEALGPPIGEGPYALVVAPRPGGAYAILPRGLVVAAYYGGFGASPLEAAPSAMVPGAGTEHASSDAPSRFPPAQRELLRRFETAHEVVHTFWTLVQYRGWPALGEGIAQYLAVRVLEDALVDVGSLVRDAEQRLAVGVSYDYEPYDRGLVTLRAYERERGRAVVDAFLRGTRALEAWDAAGLEAAAERSVGRELLEELGGFPRSGARQEAMLPLPCSTTSW